MFRGRPPAHNGIDGSPDTASGIDHIVDEHHTLPVNGEIQAGMVFIALRRAAVVPEQGDVQFSAFHRTVFDLSDAVSDPTGQYGAAAADADQTQILRTPGCALRSQRRSG